MKKIFVLLTLLILLALTLTPSYAETQMQKTNRMMVGAIQNGLAYKDDARTQSV